VAPPVTAPPAPEVPPFAESPFEEPPFEEPPFEEPPFEEPPFEEPPFEEPPLLVAPPSLGEFPVPVAPPFALPPSPELPPPATFVVVLSLPQAARVRMERSPGAQAKSEIWRMKPRISAIHPPRPADRSCLCTRK